MTELAHTQIQRLVALVAWMSQRDSQDPVPYPEAARRLGVTVHALQDDLKVLLDLTDRYKPWLASLSLLITADGFTLASRGAFRRPLRLSRDEALALMVGLSGVRGGRQLAARLGSGFGAAPEVGAVETTWALGPTPGAQVAQILSLARQARDARKKLELHYCGSDGEPSRRVVHVHQVVQAGGAWYVIAWCEKARGTRHFRAERILEILPREESFVPRRELKRVKSARGLLAADQAASATVAFQPRIVRWVREKYPDGKLAPDGRYLVRFPVADPRWLAREVLQYGAEAEVLGPPGMRELVRRWVG